MSKGEAPLRLLQGYRRTLRNYVHTKKGAHDLKDYGRALVLIALSCGAALALGAMLD